MMQQPPTRAAWFGRIALTLIAVALLLAAADAPLSKPSVSKTVITDVVDIESPVTLAAKLRLLAAAPGKKVVLLGDSLVAGRVMIEHGDAEWRKHTLSAYLQRQIDNSVSGGGTVVNLGMNGILPTDLDVLVDALLPLKPDAVVIDISLRSFSKDFSEPGETNSRNWLTHDLRFHPDGSIAALPGAPGPDQDLKRFLLNHWTAYRLHEFGQSLLDDKIADWRKRLFRPSSAAAKGSEPNDEMQLLLKVRSRYASVALDSSNPQYVAWTHLLQKLKAANQKTVVFYATENPRLLPSLIEPSRYARLVQELRAAVADVGSPVQYLPANPGLSDAVFLDHVHVDARGNGIYAAAISRELRLGPSTASVKQELGLSMSPFIETVDPKRVELGRITDLSTSTVPDDTPQKPRIALGGFPVLTVETTAPDMLREPIFLYNWWNASGAPIAVRDSYHALRQPSDRKVETPGPFTDRFEGIPARRGAASVGFFYQKIHPPTDKDRLRQLILFGQQIERSSVAEAKASISAEVPDDVYSAGAPAVTTRVRFEPADAHDISGEGVHFDVANAKQVFMLKADHSVTVIDAPGQHLIGAMAPQVLGYVIPSGEMRALYFHHTDLVAFDFDPAAQRISVDAYAYEWRERTVRVAQPVPDQSGLRVHRNLGLVANLPRMAIAVTHARTRLFAFPTWQPNGALAGLALTEHADYVGVAQDKLTMYGNAAGQVITGQGIVGNGIPLTKTVFPRGENIVLKSGTRSSSSAADMIQSSLDDPEYLSLVRGFKKSGDDIEIGVHCVKSASNEGRTTSDVAAALDSMAEFHPRTWVDHGGPDCLAEDGARKSSPYYIVTELRRHGFKYMNVLADKYDGNYNIIADEEPSNTLFYSVGLDDDLNDDWQPIAFTTTPVPFTRDFFTQQYIDTIVKKRGFVNVHTYLPYEALMSAGDAGLTLNPWYNSILKNLDEARNRGDLYLATTEKLNDFASSMRSLEVFSIGDSLFVRNPAGSVISGATIAHRPFPGAPQISATVDGYAEIGDKTLDGVNYQWYQLAPLTR